MKGLKYHRTRYNDTTMIQREQSIPSIDELITNVKSQNERIDELEKSQKDLNKAQEKTFLKLCKLSHRANVSF